MSIEVTAFCTSAALYWSPVITYPSPTSTLLTTSFTRPFFQVDPTIPPTLEYPWPFLISPVATELDTNAPFSNLPTIPPATWSVLRDEEDILTSTLDLLILAFSPIRFPTIPPAYLALESVWFATSLPVNALFSIVVFVALTTSPATDFLPDIFPSTATLLIFALSATLAIAAAFSSLSISTFLTSRSFTVAFFNVSNSGFFRSYIAYALLPSAPISVPVNSPDK